MAPLGNHLLEPVLLKSVSVDRDSALKTLKCFTSLTLLFFHRHSSHILDRSYCFPVVSGIDYCHVVNSHKTEIIIHTIIFSFFLLCWEFIKMCWLVVVHQSSVSEDLNNTSYLFINKFLPLDVNVKLTSDNNWKVYSHECSFWFLILFYCSPSFFLTAVWQIHFTEQILHFSQ